MTQDPEIRAWTPTDVIAERVRQLMQRKGWTAQRLVEEMAAAGVDWTRLIVANLLVRKPDRRRRYVTVDELLALAYVLDVAPIHLMVPLDEVTYAPLAGQNMHPQYARAWIRGERPLGTQDPRIYHSEVPAAEFPTPALPEEHREAVGEELDRIKEQQRQGRSRG